MMECGTTCLAMIFKHYGYYNIQTLLTKLGEVTTEGTSLYNMAQLAEQFGFKADGYELHAYEHLAEVQLPCIAHYNGVHFIIVYKFSRTHVWIADPAYGKDKLTKKEFLNRWNGVILVVEPTEEIFKNKDLTESVGIYEGEEITLEEVLCAGDYFPKESDHRGFAGNVFPAVPRTGDSVLYSIDR